MSYQMGNPAWRKTGSTRLEKLPSIFILYNYATSTKLNQYPRGGYIIVEQT